METQKIVNLLNDSNNEESKLAKKMWCVIDSQTAKDKYNQNNSIKFETKSIKSCLCNYSDAFILVTGDITVNAGANNGNNTHVAFRNCAPFSTCKTEINDAFIDEANHIYITVPIYNLVEYNDNYSDTSISLWDFKRDEVPDNNADFTIDNSQSFEYKTALVGKTADAAGGNSFVKYTKIVVPLKYFINFLGSVVMPLINCKVHLELNCIEDYILSSARNSAKFKITDAKLHVPIVPLSTKDNINLTKQLSEGFKRSLYWNSYQTTPAKVIKTGVKHIRVA